MLRRKVKCPCCNQPPEVVSLFWYLFVHWCIPSNTMLYTNGLLWSNDFKEITGVERTPRSTRTSCQDRQVPREVIPMERKSQREDQPSPA